MFMFFSVTVCFPWFEGMVKHRLLGKLLKCSIISVLSIIEFNSEIFEGNNVLTTGRKFGKSNRPRPFRICFSFY